MSLLPQCLGEVCIGVCEVRDSSRRYVLWSWSHNLPHGKHGTLCLRVPWSQVEQQMHTGRDLTSEAADPKPRVRGKSGVQSPLTTSPPDYDCFIRGQRPGVCPTHSSITERILTVNTRNSGSHRRRTTKLKIRADGCAVLPTHTSTST